MPLALPASSFAFPLASPTTSSVFPLASPASSLALPLALPLTSEAAPVFFVPGRMSSLTSLTLWATLAIREALGVSHL